MQSDRYNRALEFLVKASDGHRRCVGGPLNGLTVVDGWTPIGYTLEPDEDDPPTYRFVHNDEEEE